MEQVIVSQLSNMHKDVPTPSTNTNTTLSIRFFSINKLLSHIQKKKRVKFKHLCISLSFSSTSVSKQAILEYESLILFTAQI